MLVNYMHIYLGALIIIFHACTILSNFYIVSLIIAIKWTLNCIVLLFTTKYFICIAEFLINAASTGMPFVFMCGKAFLLKLC